MFTQKMKATVTGLAVALLVPAGILAQEPQPEPEQQETRIRVQLQAIGEYSVTGTVRVEESAAPGEREEMASEPLEIAFDLRGLEADQTVDVLVHEGPCESGTTTVATLGTVTADGEGSVSETREIDDERALRILRGVDPGTYHVQLQAGGTPLACGDFQPKDGSSTR